MTAMKYFEKYPSKPLIKKTATKINGNQIILNVIANDGGKCGTPCNETYSLFINPFVVM
jgi:hypothetical protein